MPHLSRRDFVTALAALAAAHPLAAAASVRPYLQSLTETAATVLWTSPDPNARLLFGPDAGAEQTVTARSGWLPSSLTGLPQGFWLHAATLTGLTPRTLYRYRPLDGQPAKFRTPGSGRSRMVIFGDSGAETDAQKQLAVRMTARQPDLILHTGDLVYPAGDADSYLRKYFGLYQDLFAAAPAFPCPGNHDYYHAGGRMFVEFNKVPRESVPPEGHGRYYSFDWDNAHFVVLDSNTPLEEAAAGRGPMLDWLERDLAATTKYWRIAMFHHPPYAGGPNQADPLCDLVRRHLVPILERHHIDLVFSGHEHNYQRTHPVNGIVYFTTGGGGAEIYAPLPRPEAAIQQGRHHFLEAQLEPTVFTIQAIGVDGRAFDSFTLKPAPRLLGPLTSAVPGVDQVAPGGLVTLMGRSLSPVEVRGNSPGLRVTVNGQPAAVLYANASQINFRLPLDFTGPAKVKVENANGSVECDSEIAPTAPAIFAVFSARGPVTVENPAHAGDLLSVYFTGRGLGKEVSARIDAWETAVTCSAVPSQPGVERADFTFTNAGNFVLVIDGIVSNSVPIPAA